MKVASFTIDHNKLLRGIYVSRKDKVGEETITTFDIRMKRPNIEPCMDIAAIHTIEHLMAVYLRADEKWANEVIYIGPMGCRTGMYLILKGDLVPDDILEIVKGSYKYIVDFDKQIPATTAKECGNYLDHNLGFAKWESKKYLEEVLEKMSIENMIYPN